MEDLSEIMARADAHLAEAAWGAAAVSYAHGAAIAGRAGDRTTAGLAWERAGECWRRDDRPSSAAQALELAVSHAGEASAGASARVKLAAVLGELGQSEVSARLCEAALGGDPDPTTRAIALDTWVDSLIGLGRREEARVRLDELGRVAVGGLGIARLFREAQLARLFGRLDDATAALGEALTTLGDAPGAQIGVAAAEAELAEVAALRGDLAEALELYDGAMRKFQALGRPSLGWRAEAGRVRAAIDVGLRPLTTLLDEGVAYAEGRGLLVLELDLRLARAVGTRAGRDGAAPVADLVRAIEIASRGGLLHRRGRARIELARHRRDQAPTLTAQAEADLVGHEPWSARARLARAHAVREFEPRVARDLALAALVRFEAMDMARDAEDANALAQELL